MSQFFVGCRNISQSRFCLKEIYGKRNLRKRNRNRKQEPRTSATRTRDSCPKGPFSSPVSYFISFSVVLSFLWLEHHPLQLPIKGEGMDFSTSSGSRPHFWKLHLIGQSWHNPKGHGVEYDDWLGWCVCMCVCAHMCDICYEEKELGE